MSTEIDFSDRTRFPGEVGNPFDVILHKIEDIDRIPAPLFALLLAGIAAVFARFHWPLALGLWGFFLLDWLLLALLPKMGRSYGPPKPPTLVLALLRAPVALLPLPLAAAAQVVGTLLVIYGFWIEPQRLQVTYQKLYSPKLKNKEPLRLLHLGDLHMERITRRERRLLEKIEELHPDLILFSGDVLNLSYLNDPKAWEDARWVLSQLKAPLGVFLVTGSTAVDLEQNMPALLKDLPLHWLQDQQVTLTFQQDTIEITGVRCTHRPFDDGPRLQALLRQPSEHLRILLYHTPDLTPIAAPLGVDLQLSGHTHGGQVRLPWYGALFTGSLYGKKFEAGRYQEGDMTLYVTRGIGLEGAGAPRVRFLCAPEIILWELSAPPQ